MVTPLRMPSTMPPRRGRPWTATARSSSGTKARDGCWAGPRPRSWAAPPRTCWPRRAPPGAPAGQPHWSGTLALRHRDGRTVTVWLLAHRRHSTDGDGAAAGSSSPPGRRRPAARGTIRCAAAIMVQSPCAMAVYDDRLRLHGINDAMAEAVGHAGGAPPGAAASSEIGGRPAGREVGAAHAPRCSPSGRAQGRADLSCGPPTRAARTPGRPAIAPLTDDSEGADRGVCHRRTTSPSSTWPGSGCSWSTRRACASAPRSTSPARPRSWPTSASRPSPTSSASTCWTRPSTAANRRPARSPRRSPCAGPPTSRSPRAAPRPWSSRARRTSTRPPPRRPTPCRSGHTIVATDPADTLSDSGSPGTRYAARGSRSWASTPRCRCRSGPGARPSGWPS